MDYSSQLTKNAVESIRLGIEDYELTQKDTGRILSSIRNMHAGILLLLKEELRCLSPKGSNDVLVKADTEMIFDAASNQIVCKGKIKKNGDIGKTVGFSEMQERFIAMQCPLSSNLIKLIDDIRKERNNIEHWYSSQKKEVLQRLVAQSTLAIQEIFADYLKEDPANVLGGTWQKMLDVKELHDKLRVDYESNLNKQLKAVSESQWYKTINDNYVCPSCGMDIFEIDNDHSDIKFICKGCRHTEKFEDVKRSFPRLYVSDIEQQLANKYSLNSKKEDISEKVITCPSCGNRTYEYDKYAKISECRICGFSYKYTECEYCHEKLESYELEDAEYNNGLCSYCLYKKRKAEEED